MNDKDVRSVVALPLYALAYVAEDTPRHPSAWVEIALERWSEQYERPGYLERLRKAVEELREMRDTDLEISFDLEGQFSDREIRDYLDVLVKALSERFHVGTTDGTR
jgi:hypothetical protein